MFKRTVVFFLFVCISAGSFPLYLSAEEPGGIGLEILQLYHHEREDRKGPIVVINVLPGGPAFVAGVERGDIITHIDGEPVRDGRLTMHRIALLRPGDTVAISVQRNQQSFELRAVVGVLRQSSGQAAD